MCRSTIFFNCIAMFNARSTGKVKAHTVYPYADRAVDGVILVRPFHRLLLRADVPVMDEETFPFDHLIMLKYRYNPIVKLGNIAGRCLVKLFVISK